MQKLTEKALATHLMLTAFVAGATERVRRDERGQGAIEYMGVIIVVAVILVIVIGAASGWGGDIIGAIGERIQEVISAG